MKLSPIETLLIEGLYARPINRKRCREIEIIPLSMIHDYVAEIIGFVPATRLLRPDLGQPTSPPPRPQGRRRWSFREWSTVRGRRGQERRLFSATQSHRSWKYGALSGFGASAV